ncbi:MAG: hypothetical protein A3F84_19110 [Candidatus Handelsmanbacteria bacterium RIFCSPLOWO2_12_FULL_64_10]|uniref:HDOD domain-containing protein n=1 Tax=Handelsmanbacteria sp. (strain RIFCSPLOWO2_12_FULL_64_10) TaxID=1817868 RepID=A0A1F6C9A5_HANXR|nr:MAG: hypothetical protein A3F84_19110 [Candidatus Handelsmanbacteria bacterium RIFCSPLOWO2_12_FULL_64_10]
MTEAATASQDFFLARQPILDRSEHLVAYELLFRSGSTNYANVSDDAMATSSVIMHAFSDLGIAASLGKSRGFLNFNAALLMGDIVELLPKDKIVIELLETIDITPEIVDRCQELREMGFTLALDDFAEFRPEHEQIMPLLQIVKAEVPAYNQTELAEMVRRVKRWPVQILAEKVDTREQVDYCKEIGCDLFQGYYFAKPAIMTGKRADMSHHTVLQVLTAVLNDAETRDIEETLKHDPGLTHKLLRLVNSAAVGLRYPIASLRQAIVVLGRQQLQRWLELMLFVHEGPSELPSPLLTLAAARGRFMEIVAGIMTREGHGLSRDFEQRAFLVGVTSLLDAVLAMPIEEIVDELSLDYDIKAALVGRKDTLGEMLALTERLEQDDFEGVTQLLPGMHGVEISDLAPAQIAATGWATAVGEESGGASSGPRR